MSSDTDNAPEVPDPPEIERRPKLYGYQRIGLPVLAILPGLALFGVFGVDTSHDVGDNRDFEVRVEYLSRTRLGRLGVMTVEIENNSANQVEGVEVMVSRDYLESFDGLTFTPSDVRVEDDAYRVAVDPVPEGGTAVVTVEMEPRRYWRRVGELTVTGLGEEEIEFRLSTIVFP